MTPEDFAQHHPRLYHQTAPEAWPLIQEHGLLPPLTLLEKSSLSKEEIRALTNVRRPKGVRVETDFGRVEINDNAPLSRKALEACLDDGLSPEEWCRMLASRVFFWTSEAGLASLQGARSNRERERLTLLIDTQSFVHAYKDKIELSPINSGSTIRKPARRGHHTFAPMRDFATYRDWAEQRQNKGYVKSRDRVKEVVVPGGVPDIPTYVVDVWP